MSPGYARLYLTNRRGKTHLVPADYVSHRSLALCGVLPELGKVWLGLHSEAERRTAEVRRICGRCAQVLKKIRPEEESQMTRPDWTKGALDVGGLKKQLEGIPDDVIVAFPIDAEGNEFKYAVSVTTGHLLEDCGEFVPVEFEEDAPDHVRTDPDCVPVIFIEPYN